MDEEEERTTTTIRSWYERLALDDDVRAGMITRTTSTTTSSDQRRQQKRPQNAQKRSKTNLPAGWEVKRRGRRPTKRRVVQLRCPTLRARGSKPNTLA